MSSNLVLNKNIYLHTTLSAGGGYYLMNLIDTGIWLLSRNPGVERVNIIIHPVSVWPIKSISDTLDRIKTKKINSYFRVIKIIISKALNFFSKFEGNKELNQKKSQASIYHRVMGKNESVHISTELGFVTIKKESKRILSGFFNPKQYYEARKLWQSAHQNGELVVSKFLELSYKRITIGDLVASDALRHYPKSGGSISKCKNLWPTLLQAVAILNHIDKNISANTLESFVSVPHPFYLDELYKRALHMCGAHVIDVHHYALEFNLFEYPNNTYEHQRLSYRSKKSKEKLSTKEILSVESYLNGRISDPLKYLWYLYHGRNSTDIQLFSENNDLIEVKLSELNAVLFLHSFEDSQYIHGYDGFDDIYDWTVFTIEQLISNLDIATVFIKVHPGIDYSSYPGDKIALQRLRKKYSNEARLKWLRKDVGAKALAGRKGFIGITHHGSIAEELAYCGVPVITSAHSSWADCYDFATYWYHAEDYKQILSRAREIIYSYVPEVARDELFHYVFDYSLNEQKESGQWRRAPIYNLVYKSLMNKDAFFSLNSYMEIDQLSDSLTLDSSEFANFIRSLVSKRLGR